MRRPEAQIQKAVILQLEMRAIQPAIWFHAPNQGKRSFAAAADLKALGMLTGLPDLLILKDKRLHALELKSAKGCLTPSQRLVMAHMENCGAEVAVAHSLDEALVTLEVWGVIRREVP